MKWLLAIALLAGCREDKQAPAPSPVSSSAVVKDPTTARKLVAAGALVIDVRTADEYAGGHLPTAMNLPVDELPSRLPDVDKLVGGDKSRPVVVYCAKGRRAARAKRDLEAHGYTHVVNGGGLGDLE